VHRAQAAVCDVIEPWEHGTFVRATRYPTYWNYNLVRVEDAAELAADEVVRIADRALAGLAHRRIGFEVASAGEGARPGLEERGWKVTRFVWMRHDGSRPEPTSLDVEQVHFDAVRHLRLAWHLEDFPTVESPDHFEHEREVAMLRNAQVFAAFERDAPVGFAQLERADGGAEVTDVFVHPDHRGRGLGTALTRAAIEAAGDVTDLWIVADDEDRPKELYARLGFRPAWRLLDFLRVPGTGG
jgi:GNAT superfamily N-acetyltransferase